jgi:hypothetical protein
LLVLANVARVAAPSRPPGGTPSERRPGVLQEKASSVSRELNRISLHVKHAKEFMQMGLPYSEDLLGELTQILNISEKAIGKVHEDVRRADLEESNLEAFSFDDVGREGDRGFHSGLADIDPPSFAPNGTE